MDFDLADSSVTETLGQALARSFLKATLEAAGPGAAQTDARSAGAVIYLEGDLGAGKTTCVRSLLRTLGVAGLVRSPTYTLVETYRLAAFTCVHIDLYRLQALTEVDELGVRDVAGPGCLLLVEWPERGATALPPADVELILTYAGEGRQARAIAKTALGSLWLKNLAYDSKLVPYVSNSP